MEAFGKTYISYGSKNDIIKMWGLGDMHLGNRATEKDRLARDIERIRSDPYSFWVGIGDYADFIHIGDRRFDAECLDPEIVSAADLGKLGRVLAESVAKWLAPIADKCIGLCMGNHEVSYMRDKDQQDLHAWLCTELGVKNLRYSALGWLIFARTKVRHPVLSYQCPGQASFRSIMMMVHHGAGSAATKSGRAGRMEKFQNLSTADIVFVGHNHDSSEMSCPQLSLSADGSKIVERARRVVMCGSYLRTYASGMTGYGEVRAYSPSTLGARYVEICPATGEIR